VTDLGAGSSVVTRATAWTAATPSGPWTRHDLPTASSSARATGAACDGDVCWVAGLDGDAPAAWQVGPHGVTRAPLPALPTIPDVAPVLTLAGSVPWVALAGRGNGVLSHQEGGGWVTVQGPPGRPVSLATAPGRLVLVTLRGAATELWTAPAG
jgi:hypothetical protein